MDAGISPAEPAGNYWRSFVSGCRRRGILLAPGRTLKSLVLELEESPDFAEELVGYHYRTRYEGESRDSEVEKDLTRKIRAWERAA